MNIVIKPLTPELVADYFDFFENRAFTDDSPYRCYCQVHQMSKTEYLAAFDGLDWADVGHASRKVTEHQIETGVLRGYLAYVDGMSVGWCNSNDRANYPAEPQHDVPFYSPDKNQEKAVICFEIAPEYRMMGISTALLQQIVDDAKFEGYAAVVGFPIIRDDRYEWDCRGPIRLYEKTGFVKVAEQDGYVVMRKDL